MTKGLKCLTLIFSIVISFESVIFNNKVKASGNVPIQEMIVMAQKKIYMYSSKNFAKDNRTVLYPKRNRAENPEFKVIGYYRDNNHNLRYKVKDINKNVNTYNYVGFITADANYVVPAYYSGLNRLRTLKVIFSKIYSYKHKDLTSKIKKYKKGDTLKVQAVVTHGLATSFELTNGYYITGNKTSVVWK